MKKRLNNSISFFYYINMDDSKILEIFFTGKSNRLIRNYQDVINNDYNIKNYLDNRFLDSLSYKETLIRIKYKIEQRPTCIICGKEVEFCGYKDKLFREYCSIECKNKSIKVVEKRKKTSINKYGTDNYAKLDESINKMHNTCLLKYGRNYPYNHQKSKNTKLEKYNDENYNNQFKAKETSLSLYGVEHFTNSKKAKETNVKKYGVLSYFQTKECREKRKSKESLLKEYNTKKVNRTFNTSSIEDESYILLVKKFTNVIRNYKSEKYPFNCDFYIPYIDTYIECNYHWTHGFKPYNENELYSINLIKKWKEKNTKYYNNAINTFSIRDVNKRNIAKENNLNWIEFFSIDELKKWILNF